MKTVFILFLTIVGDPSGTYTTIQEHPTMKSCEAAKEAAYNIKTPLRIKTARCMAIEKD